MCSLFFLTMRRPPRATLFPYTALCGSVVDDGATDGGGGVVGGIDDSRIRLVRQDNQGPGAARNCGLALATGDYVTFLDADDEWLPNFLTVTLQHLKQRPDCVLCLTGQ